MTGPARALLLVSVAVVAAAGLAAGRLAVPQPPADTRSPIRQASRGTADTGALTEEAIRLYAAGQFARACDRFRTAADHEPDSAARRTDAGRCFEGWGWQALSEGRPSEAMALFRQGLRDIPDAPGLLRGFGVSAVHAGQPADAIAPLEAVAASADDVQVRMLLAHLYDRRDDAARAMRHLRRRARARP